MSDDRTLRIDSRFCGPPATGNGGYVCGRMGAFINGPAQVRLHVPVPLDRPLRVEKEPDRVLFFDGETLIGSAVPHSFAIEVPPVPTLDRARRASRDYAGFSDHPFPTCFVCGTARAEGDGLRIFAGPLGDGLVAAPFTPPADLLDGRGRLRPEFVWAALDCPGFFAGLGRTLLPMLLGEFAVVRRGDVPGAGPLVAFAWKIGQEGRKIRCGSALALSGGPLLGVGRATWIIPKDVG